MFTLDEFMNACGPKTPAELGGAVAVSFERVRALLREALDMERSACAAIAFAHAAHMDETALKHPEDSSSRARCYARSREASEIGMEIRSRTQQK